MAHAESVAQESPRHLEEPVADHERGHHSAELAVGQVKRRLELGPGGCEAYAMQVSDDRQATCRGQDLVAHPGRPVFAEQLALVGLHRGACYCLVRRDPWWVPGR